MTDPVEEAFRKSEEERRDGVMEQDGFVSSDLRRSIKEIQGDVDIQFAKLIANP